MRRLPRTCSLDAVCSLCTVELDTAALPSLKAAVSDACLIDLAKDPRNDLSNRAVAKQVTAVVIQFDVLGVDISCNTRSRARRAPIWSSMPSALRDNSHLFGLPHLNDRGRNVCTGNVWNMRHSVSMQSVADGLNIQEQVCSGRLQGSSVCCDWEGDL